MLGKADGLGLPAFQIGPVFLHGALRIIGKGGVYMCIDKGKRIHAKQLLSSRASIKACICSSVPMVMRKNAVVRGLSK